MLLAAAIAASPSTKRTLLGALGLGDPDTMFPVPSAVPGFEPSLPLKDGAAWAEHKAWEKAELAAQRRLEEEARIQEESARRMKMIREEAARNREESAKRIAKERTAEARRQEVAHKAQQAKAAREQAEFERRTKYAAIDQVLRHDLRPATHGP